MSPILTMNYRPYSGLRDAILFGNLPLRDALLAKFSDAYNIIILERGYSVAFPTRRDSVNFLVMSIACGCVPSKIGQMIVEFCAIVMAGFHIPWTFSGKCGKNKNVYSEIVFGMFVRDANISISSGKQRPVNNSIWNVIWRIPSINKTSNTQNASATRNFIPAFITDYITPFFIWTTFLLHIDSFVDNVIRVLYYKLSVLQPYKEY